MNQPLWGNKQITKMTKGKKNVLFLRNWIRSGIRKVGDLIFRDMMVFLMKIIYIKDLLVNKTCI